MKTRPATLDDAAEIAYIYNHYIATSHATFELDPVDGDEMERRMAELTERGFPFVVCEDADHIVGYAYGHPFRERPAYSFTVEVSVYVRPGALENGIGSSLYKGLFGVLNASEFHTVIAGISLPNDASIALHEKFGFTKVAHFSEVGRKFDRWFDVGYWQLRFDKASADNT